MNAEKQYQPLPCRQSQNTSQKIGFEIQDNRPPITQRYPILAVLHQSAPLQKKVAQFGLGKDLSPAHVIKLDLAGSKYKFWIKAAQSMGGTKPISEVYGDEKKGKDIIKGIGENYVYREKEKGNVTTYTLSGPLALGGGADSGTYTIEKNVQMGIALIRDHISKLPEGPTYVLIKGHSRGGVAASRITKTIKELNIPNVVVYLTLFDPVPGPRHSGEDSEIDIQAVDISTLIISLDPKRAILNPLFGAQRVSGSQRVILTLEDHLCGLQKQDQTGHKRGFTLDGVSYSAMKLANLPHGLYGADGEGQLSRLETQEKVMEFINGKIAASRLNVIESSIKPFIPEVSFSHLK